MMGISTQTEALIELYNQKVSLDTQQLSQVNYVQQGYTIQTGIGETERIKIWGVNETIKNYDYPVEKLDSRIVEINDDIRNLQEQVLNLGQTANFNGCGIDPLSFTTYAFSLSLTLLYYGRTDLFNILPEDIVTVYQDNLRYRGYTYLPPNPFSNINGTITGSVLGDSEIATASISNGSVSFISIINPGKGYTSAPTVTIDARIVQNAAGIGSTESPGIVTSIAVSNPGYGYTSAPDVTIEPPTVIGPGIGTTATGIAYVSSGIVTGFEITNVGFGYTFTPIVTVGSPGLGVTATATSTIDSNGILSSISIVNSGSNYVTVPTVYVTTPGNTVGFGTQTYVSPVPIGIYIDPVGTCFGFGCDNPTCTGYATSIANLNSQIATLQSERNDLISKVNV